MFFGFYWVLPSFTRFCRDLLVLTGFYWVLLGLSGLVLGFTEFCCVLLVFTEFYCVLLGFTEFLPGFLVAGVGSDAGGDAGDARAGQRRRRGAERAAPVPPERRRRRAADRRRPHRTRTFVAFLLYFPFFLSK